VTNLSDTAQLTNPTQGPMVRGALRTIVTVAILVTLYFVLPLDHETGVTAIAELAVGTVVLVVVLLRQIRVIGQHDYPGVRAIEALAFTIPLYILMFAAAYFLLARAQPNDFTEHLTRTDALYFCVTIFSTVGFGDITAKSELARLIVTIQMLLDLVVLGVVIRSIFSAVKVGQERRANQTQEP
jgi:voltage-gated potassium channel